MIITTATEVPVPLFRLGRILQTSTAATAMLTLGDEGFIKDCLDRYMQCDWGDVNREEWDQNDQAVLEGWRILAVYRHESGLKLWIITEADRSVTTVLLPSDY